MNGPTSFFKMNLTHYTNMWNKTLWFMWNMPVKGAYVNCWNEEPQLDTELCDSGQNIRCLSVFVHAFFFVISMVPNNEPMFLFENSDSVTSIFACWWDIIWLFCFHPKNCEINFYLLFKKKMTVIINNNVKFWIGLPWNESEIVQAAFVASLVHTKWSHSTQTDRNSSTESHIDMFIDIFMVLRLRLSIETVNHLSESIK